MLCSTKLFVAICRKALIIFSFICIDISGFPYSSDGKESACNVGDQGSIPGLGRSLGEGNGNPLQYSFLENPMDRGVRWATIQEVTKGQT